eukprot:CAMPEP_0202870788 /NCGR_PEP_ID=MMETSP1391-20130828/16777_1 /ASSEMBLY_ACC=CAM_ASM_000867 /TAXON_ID=1034604 /ORGANISM="Chlamydomonas leiostraca, Strain SAG 11-49" /LENGTH=92 /DNA_ID=CAMNT_0049551427 /DNA_START=1 /DNA_END=275 /DNA_ORIENTATION=+
MRAVAPAVRGTIRMAGGLAVGAHPLYSVALRAAIRAGPSVDAAVRVPVAALARRLTAEPPAAADRHHGASQERPQLRRQARPARQPRAQEAP